MKNTRTLIVLAVAILSGLLAVVLAARWLDRQSNSGITRIAVAATEISLGQRLTPELVKLVEEAQSSKSRAQVLADRAAGWLFYIALVSAVVTAVGWLSTGGVSIDFVLR